MIIRTYPFGWLTPFIIDDISKNPTQLELYLQLSRTDWHYAGLAVAVAQHRPFAAAYFAWLQARLFADKRHLVLGTLGIEAPRRVARLLPKLSGKLWSAASYRRLISLASDEEVHKVLRHRRKVQRRDILQLGRLPAGYRDPVLIARLHQGWKSDELRFALQIVQTIRPDLDQEKILSSLKGFTGSDLSEWVARYYQQIPFPECPWDGTDTMRPLKNFTELKRTALEFDNCIRRYLTQILRGNACYYRYEEGGKGAAVVEIVNMPAIGWIMNEALGPQNENLSVPVQKRVERALSNAGIAVPPSTIEPECWLAA